MSDKQIENSVDISRDPITVLSAFTDHDVMKAWWGVDKSLIQLYSGGQYTLAWMSGEEGFGYVSSGIVREYEKGRVLDLSDLVYLNPDKSILGPLSMRITVEGDESKSRLQVVQGGFQTGGDWDWYYDAVDSGWSGALKQLKQYLES